MKPDRSRLRVLVVAGGAFGSLVRFAATDFVGPDPALPWGTLLVNVAGSIGLGYLVGKSLSHPLPPGRLAFVGVGVMGAVTTFGGVMVQLLDLSGQGRVGVAILYVAISVLLGVASALATLRVGAGR